METDLSEYIYLYQSLGFCVIPAVYGQKNPAVDEWKPFQDRQPTPEELDGWFNDGKPHNLGVIAGRVSDNLVVLDFDSLEAYERFLPKHEKLEQRTLVVRTSKGRHVYLRTPKPVKSFRIPELKLEVRSEGNFIVLPPSLHPSGCHYEFVNPKVTEILLMEGLEGNIWEEAERLGVKRERPKPQPTGQQRLKPYTGLTPDCVESLMQGVFEGDRHEAAIRIAGFNMVLRQGGTKETYRVLEDWSEKKCSSPLPKEELTRIVQDVEKVGYNYSCDDPFLKAWCRNPETCRLNKHGEGVPEAWLLWRKLERVNLAFDVIQGNPDPRLCISIPQAVSLEVPEEKRKKGQEPWEEKIMPVLVFSDRRVYPATPETFRHFGIANYTYPEPPQERWSTQSFKKWKYGEAETPNRMHVYLLLKDMFEVYLDCVEVGMYWYIPLWFMGTYFHILFATYPIVGLTGTKESGKSKILKLGGLVCFNAVWSPNLSVASMFRKTQNAKATLLCDEMEGLGDAERRQELRSLLNASYEKGAYALRTNKQTGRQEEFDVYSPRMLGSIQGFEDVLESRATVFTMLRTASEKANREIDLMDPVWGQIRDKLYILLMVEWQNVLKTYRETENIYGIKGRDWQLWRPMLALAKWLGDARVYANILKLAKLKTAYRKAKEQTETDGLILLKILRDYIGEDGWYERADLKRQMDEIYGEEIPKHLTGDYVGKILERFHLQKKRTHKKRWEYFLTRRDIEDRCRRYGVLEEEVGGEGEAEA